MLIDSTHKKWILATGTVAVLALGVFVFLDGNTPGGLTGGSTVGLWFGIAGSVLMVYAGLLSVLRRVPSWWWIGARKTWVRGHIWLGLLSGVLILCHSGFRWGGLLERALWIVLLLTLATGLYGLLVQQILPRMITSRIPCEAPYEQIPHLCRTMRSKADDLVQTVWNGSPDQTHQTIMASQLGIGAKHQLQMFYEQQVRPFLSEEYQRRSSLANPLQASVVFARLRALPGLADVSEQVNHLETFCTERRLLAEQERLHHWLHGWLLLHIPLSVALLVLSVAHVIATLYY